MSHHGMHRAGETLSSPPSFGQSFDAATSLPVDLPGVADLFDHAIVTLQQGKLTAGTATAIAALARFRSLLGEVDPRPSDVSLDVREGHLTEAPSAPASEPVLTVSGPELRQRINGLVQRGVPLLVSVDHARTGQVLSRLEFLPATGRNGELVDVTA